MKRKEIISFSIILLMALLSVFGMTRYERMATDLYGIHGSSDPVLYGTVEITIVFFAFALSAVWIAFGKTNFLVFAVGFAAAAACAVFAERFGFLFASVTALLLLHRYSGDKISKIFPVLALLGDGLCAIPFSLRLSHRVKYFKDDIGYLKEQNAHENMTYKILLLLLLAFLVFCLIKSLRLPPMARKRKGRCILFYVVALLTAVADIGYCVCFTGENVSACVLFSWLFLLLFIARDGDPVLGSLLPAGRIRTVY